MTGWLIVVLLMIALAALIAWSLCRIAAWADRADEYEDDE